MEDVHIPVRLKESGDLNEGSYITWVEIVPEFDDVGENEWIMREL